MKSFSSQDVVFCLLLSFFFVPSIASAEGIVDLWTTLTPQVQAIITGSIAFFTAAASFWLGVVGYRFFTRAASNA